MFGMSFVPDAETEIKKLIDDGLLPLFNKTYLAGGRLYLPTCQETLGFLEHVAQANLLPHKLATSYFFTGKSTLARANGAYWLNNTVLTRFKPSDEAVQIAIEGDNWQDMQDIYAKFQEGSLKLGVQKLSRFLTMRNGIRRGHGQPLITLADASHTQP